MLPFPLPCKTLIRIFIYLFISSTYFKREQYLEFLPLKQNGTSWSVACRPLHMSLAEIHVLPLWTCFHSLMYRWTGSRNTVKYRYLQQTMLTVSHCLHVSNIKVLACKDKKTDRYLLKCNRQRLKWYNATDITVSYSININQQTNMNNNKQIKSNLVFVKRHLKSSQRRL